MATKGNFTLVEWKRLLESPLLVGFAINGDDSSGFLSTLTDGLANETALAEAKLNPRDDELIWAVTDDLMTSEGRAISREGIRERALAELKQTAAILDAKAPANSAAFKAWLGQIADEVAAASSAGRALASGGARLNDAEKETLADIKLVFGT